MVVTTLDEFVAIKTADRPLTGWSGVTSANFSAVVAVIPIPANEIRDPALWLYIASFVDTALWQGLSKYNVTGNLNMALVDVFKFPVTLYLCRKPRRRDAITVGPAGNSIMANMRKAGSVAIPIRVTKNLLRALTGVDWATWSTVDQLSDPGEDEWYQATKMLEHYVCVLDIAAGVITATTFRILVPHIDDPVDAQQYGTHQGSWLMDITKYSAPNSEDYNLTWYAYQSISTCTDRLANQESRYWTTMGFTCFNYLGRWHEHDMWVDDADRRWFHPIARVSEASDVARLSRALGIYQGPNFAMELRSRRAFELFFSSNAIMQASVVSVAQMSLGISMSVWTGYAVIDRRWYTWMRGFIEMSTFNAVIIPNMAPASQITKMIAAWIDAVAWELVNCTSKIDTNTALSTKGEMVA
ncbi:hypothetical protein Aduo_002436 [Ancylostoma duodenale]